jgi:creatinine amidohydrolase
VLFVSAHGGNAGPVGRAVARLRAESRDVLQFSPSWDGDPHAGLHETAMMLVIAPETVDLSRARAGDLRPLTELLPLLRAGGVRAVTDTGVLGDPRPATAAAGERLLAELAEALVAAVQRWHPVQP